jgi:hypothetical protein
MDTEIFYAKCSYLPAKMVSFSNITDLEFLFILSVFFFFPLLKQDIAHYPGWPQTPDPPASPSRVVGIKNMYHCT